MWYREGTVSIDNGTVALTGVGTLWQDNIITGDILYLDDLWWEILSVDSDTGITLKATYTGLTKTDSAYAIIRAGAANGDLISRLTAVTTKWRNREDEITAWQGGTVDGGPNSDGQYPLTDPDGVVHLVDCPASISSVGSAYLGAASSDPVAGMVTGSLYFNDVANVIKYYDGSNWVIWTEDGRSVLNGTTAPDDGTDGLAGDFWINTTTHEIYGPKTTTWGSPTDLNGTDGTGFTGGSYDAGTGIVTFTSADGLGFSTTDLRGADGYTPIKDTDYFDGVDGTKVTGASSSKTGTTTTVNIEGDFVGAPYSFDLEDGLRGLNWLGDWSGATPYVINDGVLSGGTSYICIADHTNFTPPNATYWEVLALKGTDGAGSGDMLASVYDPQNLITDSFARANHTGTQAATTITEDITHRFVTDTEKTTWNGKQDALVADTDYLTPTTASTTYAPVLGADDNYVTDAEKIVIGATSGTNTGDQDLSSYATKTGIETLTNKTITDPVLTGTPKEDIYTITDGASVSFDPANGSIQIWTLGASRTPAAPTGWDDGESILLMIQDGTDYTITWTNVAVTWMTDSATAPTLKATGYTSILLLKQGGVIYGFRCGDGG